MSEVVEVKEIIITKTSKLVYRTGCLFENAPKESTILAHACNAQGRWGRGIALEFAKRYPVAYTQYRQACGKGDRTGAGFSVWNHEENVNIGCLITSESWNPPDPEEDIVQNTFTAVKDLITINPRYNEIHSPKINSGIFKVPWELTEEALIHAIKSFTDRSITWTVWELPNKEGVNPG